ncbi:glycosyltransferase [Aeromonas veronii]|uniref:glycosyltransferase n=1 Tax=Aeromonas veronii TaxID=654 RepID=UPI0013021C78|nr:glycosyltransferase [Aeromonas veronii]KAE9637913.1 glycosyltransferase [Aeromonas veronii]
MKYLIVNPYGNASHGIANYIKSLQNSLVDIDFITFENKKNLSPQKFREELFSYVTSRFGYDDVIIEAPEAKASTLLLPRQYKTHIRLHCPLAVAQKYDGQNPNEQEYSNELRVIHKAHIVSSPSYALAEEMKNEVSGKNFFYYKNPIDPSISNVHTEKKYDLVFMGRFQELKGISYINRILELLPSSYNVLLFGANSNLLKISKKIKCNVHRKGQVTGDARFELIRSAKCLMLPSKFENCSMVILESLACHVPVVAWNVGGNSEIASTDVLSCSAIEDYQSFSNYIINYVSNPPKNDMFETAISLINNDFINGISALINKATFGSSSSFCGINFSQQHSISIQNNKSQNFLFDSSSEKIRVFGVAYSNEHIEELWAPVIEYLGYEYRYVCRRPLGYHSVFKHSPFPVNTKWVCQFDWVKDTERLIKQIKAYRPNCILFHNGAHPVYKHVIDSLRSLRIPIVFSELGWFPQKDHVYFDQWGVNGLSYIANQTAEQLCERVFNDSNEQSLLLKGDYALVVTQLENDTNLIVNSPRFKNNENFISYVISELDESVQIIIKPHPLDKNMERYEKFVGKNVSLSHDSDTMQLIKSAHSVIGINSTVLLQSLEYDVNIYSFGRSILDNKGVAIDCSRAELSSQWSLKLIGSRERRDAVIQSLKQRQLNLIDIRHGELKNKIAIRPLVENKIFDFSHLLPNNAAPIKKVSQETKETDNNTDVSTVSTILPHGSKRKFNKLLREPKKFIADMIHNIKAVSA